MKKNSIKKGMMLTLASIGLYGLVAATNLPRVGADDFISPSPAMSGLELTIEQNQIQPLHWNQHSTYECPTLETGLIYGVPGFIGVKIAGNWDKPIGWQASVSCYWVSAVLRAEARFNCKYHETDTYAFVGSLSFFDLRNGNLYPCIDAGVGCELGNDKGFAFGIETGFAFPSSPFWRSGALGSIFIIDRY